MIKKQTLLRAIGSGIFVLLLGAQVALAAGDLGVSKVWLSQKNVMADQSVRIYTTLTNYSTTADTSGVVQFFDRTAGKQIGSDVTVFAIAGGTASGFVDWKPSYGEHKLTVKFIPWESDDNPGNNSTALTIFADRDADGDGVLDRNDNDDDNDGHPDGEDAFRNNSSEWLDTDGDGLGDNKDTDDDGDGCEDNVDLLPLDSKDCYDTDHDKIGDNTDEDDDNDGLSDLDEVKKGSDSHLADTDGDGVGDLKDEYPRDAKRSGDEDLDGVDNLSDPDLDGDTYINEVDSAPFDSHIWHESTRVHEGLVKISETTTGYLLESSEEGEFVFATGERTKGKKTERAYAESGEYRGYFSFTNAAGESEVQDFTLVVERGNAWVVVFGAVAILLGGGVIYVFIWRRRHANLTRLQRAKKWLLSAFNRQK